jgi:DNA-binding transcriptional MerR regulator
MKWRQQPRDPISDEDQARLPKYTIGVVSKLLRVPPQILRRYEEAGLLEPARQDGKNRLYSDYDLAILEEITELSYQGVNATGIRYILQMRQEVHMLRQQIEAVKRGEAHTEQNEQGQQE